MAMLTMRARRFLKKTERKASRENKNREPVRRNVTVETIDAKALMSQDGFGYDWSDQVEEGPTNFTLMAYTSSGSSNSSSSDSERKKRCSPEEPGISYEDNCRTCKAWITEEPMAWQTDYCIMKEGMSTLRGWKSVPGMTSSEREMERG
nr:hypothetical protein [Tanacetum cinerariifolium]